MEVKEVFEAVKNHNLGIVKFSIETGVVPANVVDHEEKTLAHAAAMNGELAIFKYVVEKDPFILRKYGAGKDNNLALMKLAVQYGSLDIVKYLVENWYTETFSKDEGGEFDPVLDGYDVALIWAARYGRLTILKYLIEKGNVDFKSPPSDRAVKLLTNAVEFCHRDIIEFLVEEKKVKISSIEENKNCSVPSVIRKCDLDFLRFILDEMKVNWDIDQQDDASGYTAVHEALLNDRMDILKYLVEQKHPNLNIACKDTKETPIYYAVRGSEMMCEYLVKHGADVNWRNHEGNTPLHCASSDEMCMYLIKQDANVNMTNNYGDTPLHGAIRADCENWPRYISCKNLIEYGADVNRANNEGETPLHLALENEDSLKSYRLCKQLIEYGADIDQKSKNGETVAHKAAVRNRLKILEYLVGEKHADISIADKNGRTPLHGAAQNGREGVCKYLVEHGANIDQRDNYGWTPLHFAASNEHYEVCKYLIKQGADTHAKNNSGKSPKEETSNSRIIQYMESASNASNLSNVKRSRRSVPLSFLSSISWQNRGPFEYPQRRIATKLRANWDCFKEKPSSVISPGDGIQVPYFQNFLVLFGLLIRNRKTSDYSTQVSLSLEAISPHQKIDPLAETAATYLSQFECR